MRRTLSAAISVGLLAIVSSVAQAQYGNASHLVTVVVNPISLLQVVGGGVNLNISSSNAIAGQDQMSVTNAATQLLWGTNSSAQKITIKTNNAAPLFMLKAEALNPTQGISLGEVSVSSLAVDLLLNVGRSSGSASVQYTGIAFASQGVGSDAHTITFTIAAQ